MALITTKINASNIQNPSNEFAGTGPYEFITEKIWTADGAEDTDSYARIFFTNVFDRTKYSGYKLFFHWLGHTVNGNLRFRMQTGTSASTSDQISDANYFGNIVSMDSSDTSYKNSKHTNATEGQIFDSVWPENRGGITGEMNFTMLSNSPTAAKAEDHFRPYAYGTLVGYHLGDQYRRVDFASRYNSQNSETYYTGFHLFLDQISQCRKGSHLSLYGIRWSTT